MVLRSSSSLLTLEMLLGDIFSKKSWRYIPLETSRRNYGKLYEGTPGQKKNPLAILGVVLLAITGWMLRINPRRILEEIR